MAQEYELFLLKVEFLSSSPVLGNRPPAELGVTRLTLGRKHQ